MPRLLGPARRRHLPLGAGLVATIATVTTALAASLLAGVAPAAEQVRLDARPGSAGIGDPYFPLDGNGGIDVRRYRIHDRYQPATGQLSGTTRLTLTATKDLSRFNLDLLLPVRSVRVAGARAGFRKPTPHELQIRPARPIAAGTTVAVVVRYAGRPDRASYLGASNWLATEREVVTMSQPHMAPWWFPANDHPRDKARMDITITAPRWMTVVANGALVSRRASGRMATTRWRAREPMAPYLAFFAAGDFEVARGVRGGLPWYVAVSRGLPRLERLRAMRLMKRTAAVVDWTERILGPYPFSTTGGVTTSLDPGFALENQTRPTYPALGPHGLAILVHEVAHQWFGDSVSVQSWRDIWLNEGAATFMEARWAESHGGPTAQQWLEQSYAELRRTPSFWQLRLDAPGRGHLFDFPVYLRGGMTFQALRHRLGDPTFSRLIQTWLADNRGGHGSTPEFVALAERISGQDLDGFFDAWLRSRTAPARTAANGF